MGSVPAINHFSNILIILSNRKMDLVDFLCLTRRGRALKSVPEELYTLIEAAEKKHARTDTM